MGLLIIKTIDMTPNNSFAGTVLESAYVPEYFESADTLIKKLPDSESIAENLPAILLNGTAISIDVLTKYSAPLFCSATIVKELPGFFERIFSRLFKKNDLVIAIEKYNNLITAIQKDFEEYKLTHETLLDESSTAVETINRKKVVMKDYLLEELYKSLQRCGMNGEFHDMATERFDLRNWPINEKYDLINQKHLTIKKTMNSGDLAFIGGLLAGAGSFGAFGLAIAAGQMANPIVWLLAPAIALYMRRKLKGINNEIKTLSVIVSANECDMTADLSQLEMMKKAFENISCIYTDVLQTIRPVMKKLLDELERESGNDVNSFPEDKANALFNISRLLKEMAEKQIVPYKGNQSAIHQNVCEYSNDLSNKYNELKETIVNI